MQNGADVGHLRLLFSGALLARASLAGASRRLAAVAGLCLRLTLRLCLRLAAFAARRLVASRTISRWFVGRCGLLVGITAVVGLVKAATLEHDRRASSQKPAQLQLLALGTFLQLVVVDTLIEFESMSTRIALVVVSWHSESPKNIFPS